RKIRSRSRPSAAVRQSHPPPVLPAPAQSRSPPPANPAASDRSNSMSRRLGAPHRQTQTPPRRSPASARCSTVAAARGPPVPRRLPLHPSLAPVQTPVFAPVLTSPINSQIARRPSPDGYAGLAAGTLEPVERLGGRVDLVVVFAAREDRQL